MAIDYSGYAQAYGGGAAGGGGGVSGGAMLGQGISSIINRARAKKATDVAQGYRDILSQDFMQGNMFTMLSKDASEWGDLSGTGITNAFQSYSNWKESIEGTPQEKIAKRQGLLNPIAWKQQHDAYMGMIAPSIANKIIAYQAKGNKSNSQMREWIEKKGLNSFISSNFRDNMNPAHVKLQSWALPKIGLGQQALNLGRGLTEDWTLGGAIGVGTTALTAPIWAPPVAKGLQLLGSNIPGMANIGASYAAAAPVAGVGLGIGASQLAGQVGHAIGGKVGEQTAELGTSAGMTVALGALNNYVNTHGYSNLMKLVVKKKGRSFAMKTLGKIGLGLIGGGVTGGIATAAMAAWTMKDLYDVVQVVNEEVNK